MLVLVRFDWKMRAGRYQRSHRWLVDAICEIQFSFADFVYLLAERAEELARRRGGAQADEIRLGEST